jgi:hypothetical protein
MSEVGEGGACLPPFEVEKRRSWIAIQPDKLTRAGYICVAALRCFRPARARFRPVARVTRNEAERQGER